MSLEELKSLFTSFEKAVKRFEEVVALPATAINNDALIQRFEFSLELSWKLMQEALFFLGREVEFPKKVVRVAAEYKLIDDPDRWIDFIESRNKTSHIYDEEMAKEVALEIRDFPIHAHKLLKKVKEFCLE